VSAHPIDICTLYQGRDGYHQKDELHQTLPGLKEGWNPIAHDAQYDGTQEQQALPTDDAVIVAYLAQYQQHAQHHKNLIGGQRHGPQHLHKGEEQQTRSYDNVPVIEHGEPNNLKTLEPDNLTT
jgi:hypothetical protein